MQTAIGLGSNLGNCRENIHHAVVLLEASGFRNPQLSHLYETEPVDCVPGTPNFINAAVAGTWENTIPNLLQQCKIIEEQLGRPPDHASDEARVIDLDILLVGGTILDGSDVRIPHPQMHSRLFVLLPLCDIVPDWVIPTTGKTVAQTAEDLKHSTDSCPAILRL